MTAKVVQFHPMERAQKTAMAFEDVAVQGGLLEMVEELIEEEETVDGALEALLWLEALVDLWFPHRLVLPCARHLIDAMTASSNRSYVLVWSSRWPR